MSREDIIHRLVRQADASDMEAAAAHHEAERLRVAYEAARHLEANRREDAFNIRCAIELIAGTPQSKFRQSIIQGLKPEKVG